jgi:hypothetical protein
VNRVIGSAILGIPGDGEIGGGRYIPQTRVLSSGNAALPSLRCGPNTPWETPDGITPNRHDALPGLCVRIVAVHVSSSLRNETWARLRSAASDTGRLLPVRRLSESQYCYSVVSTFSSPSTAGINTLFAVRYPETPTRRVNRLKCWNVSIRWASMLRQLRDPMSHGCTVTSAS